MRRLFGFALLPLMVACGDDANRLYGSIASTYSGLPFQRAECLRQEDSSGKALAYHVRYVDAQGYTQAHVIANAPVVAGQEKDLVKDGALSRETYPTSYFPDLETGRLVFDSLGEIGSHCSGHFYVTFKASSGVKHTLDGDFSATLQKL